MAVSLVCLAFTTYIGHERLELDMLLMMTVALYSSWCSLRAILRFLVPNAAACQHVQLFRTEQPVQTSRWCTKESVTCCRAPEVSDDQPSVAPGPASDIWSLAAVFLHCLTGKPPYEGEKSVFRAVLAGKHPYAIPRTLPQQLQTMLAQCFESDPNKRPDLVAIKQVCDLLREVLTVSAWQHQFPH